MSPPRCTLSPLTAPFIETVRLWRNQERIRLNMVDSRVIDTDAQQAWFAGLADDPARRFYLLAIDGRPLGSLYYSRIDGTEAEIGYYLGEERAPPGIGLIFEWLSLEQGFSGLGLQRLHALVKPENSAPQKLHALFGFERLADTDDASPLRHYAYANHDWQNRRYSVLTGLPRGMRALAETANIHPEPVTRSRSP